MTFYFDFSKGYALIEYESYEEAERAIAAMDGSELLTQIINVDWAFSHGPIRRKNTRYASQSFISTLAKGIIKHLHYGKFMNHIFPNLIADLLGNDVQGALGGDIDFEV